MMWGGGGHWGVYWYQLPYYSTSAADVHYVKCFDSTSATPLNKRRLQFPSQYNTYELDPAVPEYYPWNGTAAGNPWRVCLRMHFLPGTILFICHEN